MRRRSAGLAAALSIAALATAAAAPAASPAPRERAEAAWMLHCQGCHRPDGSGAPGVVPTLAGVGRFLALPGGRAYLVQVPGVAQSALDDATLAAVLDWMLARFSPGTPPDPAPYATDEVRRLRASPLLDAGRTRAALLAGTR